MSNAWGLEEITTMRAMAIEGGDEEEIAYALKRQRVDVRSMAVLLGIDLTAAARLEWCDKCACPRSHLDPTTGWCSICTTKDKQARQRLADEEEERRLMREANRETNRVKKARERMREEYDANPRKGKGEPPE